MHQVTLAMQNFLWSPWLQHVMRTTLRMHPAVHVRRISAWPVATSIDEAWDTS